MRRLFSAIRKSVNTQFGSADILVSLLESNPEIKADLIAPLSVHSESVAKWHEWGKARQYRLPTGVVAGQRFADGVYSHFQTNIQAFCDFGISRKTLGWSCDISDIEGLSASKSDLYSFQSLDDLVMTNSSDLITPVTIEQLMKTLKHHELRIVKPCNDDDYFVQYAWDKRTFLINSGGSHHFAAARFLSKRVSKKVPLVGTLRRHIINGRALLSLRSEYDMYVVASPAAMSLLHGAMKKMAATYLEQPLPEVYGKLVAILLPRNEQQSARASEAFRAAGFFDLGAFLTGLTARGIATR